MLDLQTLYDLLRVGYAEPIDVIVFIIVVFSVLWISTLVIQSYIAESNIKELYDQDQRMLFLGQERASRAQMFSAAIVLVSAAFVYYQFIFEKREKEEQVFSKAEEVLYSLFSSTPARIGAINRLRDWGKDKGPDKENDVTRAIIAGLRVWAKKTDLNAPCENNRTFVPERIGLDTKEAILVLKSLSKRTIQLDFSELRLQNADFSAGETAPKVNLRQADFHGSDLSGAKLMFTDLRGADFYCANLYGANLRGSLAGKADQTSKPQAPVADDFRETTSFVQVRMQRANLENVDFEGGNLIDADLKHAQINKGTSFINADMQHAILEKLRFTEQARWKGANVNRACLDNILRSNLERLGARGMAYKYPTWSRDKLKPVVCRAPYYGNQR